MIDNIFIIDPISFEFSCFYKPVRLSLSSEHKWRSFWRNLRAFFPLFSTTTLTL